MRTRCGGGEGEDTFALGSQSGGTVIADFVVGQDRLALYEDTASLAQVLSTATVIDGNTVLTLATGGTVIVLGVTADTASLF